MVDALTKKIPLMEIFGPTIQGEGCVLGQQTYFIRLGLCDYKCTKCDSMHAVDPTQVSDNAEWLTQAEILQKFLAQLPEGGTEWVTLSGGNPAIHDLTWLCERLVDMDFRIAIETQGTFCPDWLKYCEVVTVSPKGPGMGERFELSKFLAFLERAQEDGDLEESLSIKVVIFDDADIKFAHMIADTMQLTGISTDRLYLSQGNPFPPGSIEVPADLPMYLREKYLDTFDKLKADQTLSQCKWLPQWHVWLWSNRQGV
jgi:7-carboxy-7-deazaguanine synthase